MTLMNLPLVPGLCKSTARGVEEIIRIDWGRTNQSGAFQLDRYSPLFCQRGGAGEDVKQTNKLANPTIATRRSWKWWPDPWRRPAASASSSPCSPPSPSRRLTRHTRWAPRFVSCFWFDCLWLVFFLRGWILGARVKFCAAVGGGGGAGGCGGGGDCTRILIKGGTVVNAHRAEEADVYIEDGVVVAVRPNIPVSSRSAFGRFVLGVLGLPISFGARNLGIGRQRLDF